MPKHADARLIVSRSTAANRLPGETQIPHAILAHAQAGGAARAVAMASTRASSGPV